VLLQASIYMDYSTLINEIRNKEFRPIYFLTGEEPFFIDKIVSLIEHSALEESERSFNQVILYGSDTSMDAVIGEAKRYPMMAERVVVIVKEAQHLNKLEQLEAYAQNPQNSTVLVFAYKYKKADKRKKVFLVLAKKHVLFESKKVYDNKVPEWIELMLKERHLKASSKAIQMLAESLGTDLGRIDSEVDKLSMIAKKGEEISPELVEENVGISKDFNNFELCNALNRNDFNKALRVQQYFQSNPKDNPLVLTIGLLYRNFRILMILAQIKGASQGEMMKQAGVNMYALREYEAALKYFDVRKIARIMAYLRETDMKSKGVNNASASDSELLKELLFKIVYQ
jgi:DNA polymerase-3 subunit delta